jgi:hypothetical protein
MIEENGYFYGRGTSDMKAHVAVWVDNLVRYREEGFKPKRSIKLALTCGEETNSALNGAGWLATHEREAIDAEFALNEGGWGDLDAQGRRISLGVLAAEKTSQNFELEATNPGGHSSLPVPDNAIYHLVRAVDRISRYEFPVQLDDANRANLAGLAKIVGGEAGTAMLAVLKNPNDAQSVAVLDQNPKWHAILRTTCAGHHALGRPRDQCLAAARHREYQLPDLPGRDARRDLGPTGQNRGRPGCQDHGSRSARPARETNPADAADPEAGRETCG